MLKFENNINFELPAMALSAISGVLLNAFYLKRLIRLYGRKFIKFCCNIAFSQFLYLLLCIYCIKKQ